MIPPTSAAKHNINVAELAVSFAIFASGWISVVTKSTVASIAEFNISQAAIAAHIKIINNHSYVLTLKISPQDIANIVAHIIIIIFKY